MTGPDRADFLAHLISELLNASQRRAFNNTDRLRFPDSPKASLRERALAFAASQGFYRAAQVNQESLRAVLQTEGLGFAYGLFEDEFSRDVFIKLLAYRALGDRHVRLPLNNKEYWKLRESVGQYLEKRGTVSGIPVLGALDLFNIQGIRLHAHPLNIVNTFLLEQYACTRGGVGVREGDVVVDAGGCWGDTALYFAQKGSQVFCFECIPSNIKIIDQNLGMNPLVSGKITVIQKALWGRAQERLVFKDTGPGSRPNAATGGVEVETETLDHFVSVNSIQRIDFLKMDIEGSEPEALRGAEQTIRKHRPQLAISIYHDLGHFASIPRWISELGLGYRLYLDHFTIHGEETVLFATARS